MFKKFFSMPFFEDHVPHVKHIVYPVLMMATGWKSMTDYKWMTFGAWLFWLGVVLALVVIWSIGWRGPIEYWRQIEDTVTVMLKIKSPEIWVAMGFKDIPASVQIAERKTDEQGNFSGFSYKNVPITPVVLNTIANKVLLSGTTEFSEPKFKNVIPNFKKVQTHFKTNGYIIKSSKHPKASHTLTKKGMQIMYEYADQAIVRQIESERKNGKIN